MSLILAPAAVASGYVPPLVQVSSYGLTAAIDTTGADLLVASLGSNNPATLTDNKGNTFTQIAARNECSLWYNRGGTVGSGHTFTPNNTGAIVVAAFTGSVASPLDQFNSTLVGYSTAAQTGSITPTQSAELIVATTYMGAVATTASVDSGFTIILQIPSGGPQNQGTALAYLIQSVAATVNPTFSLAAGAYMHTAIASFKHA
jgi:hypothetical protein